MLRKQHFLTAYFLIGIGIYFLLQHLNLSFFQSFYGWPTILMIIGLSFLLHSYTTKEHQSLFVGVILFGFGLHFHGLKTYDFWYDHWSIYTLIVGIAFLLRFFKTKSGFITAIILIGISILMIFSISLPEWFNGIFGVVEFIETFWPVVLIVIGVLLLRKK